MKHRIDAILDNQRTLRASGVPIRPEEELSAILAAIIAAMPAAQQKKVADALDALEQE